MKRRFAHRWGWMAAILLFGLIVVCLLYKDAWGIKEQDVKAVGTLIATAAFCWVILKAVCRKENRPLPKDSDSDEGIDWQTKASNGQVWPCSGKWVLMVQLAEVFEMDALCAKLKAVGVRFKLETLHYGTRMSDTYFGQVGVSVRMRLWVHEDSDGNGRLW